MRSSLRRSTGRFCSSLAASSGERDAVRHFIPGLDLYADPGAGCADFRGATLIPGAGHWVQQEAPEPCNQALDAFLRGL